jgi:hypothetical protein
LSLARRACVLLLMVGLVPAVRAEDPQAPAKPPTSGPPPAKTPAVKGVPPAANTAKKPAATTPAKPAAPEADDELLEFLGSVDSETGDQDWIDYLSQTDIAKAAKK